MICIAVVKIWKVVTHLDQVVDYAEDHNKTNLSNFKDLNDLMDYNEQNPDNPKSREIQNTECYSVDTDNGVKWFLLVVCYNNHCSQNYKSIYLGK